MSKSTDEALKLVGCYKQAMEQENDLPLRRSKEAPVWGAGILKQGLAHSSIRGSGWLMMMVMKLKPFVSQLHLTADGRCPPCLHK
jgi:hypothetical protein